METRVVHCKREQFTKYIGRPSILGNPYSHKAGTLAQYKTASVEEACSSYESYARERIKSDPLFRSEILACYGETLGCWCKVRGHEPCHGDVIVKLISELI